MMIGKFDKEGDGYRGRIFSRERCGRVITFRPMPVKQDDGPDFVVISVSETQDGDEFAIGAAWKKTSSKGKPYLLVKLDRRTFCGALRVNQAARRHFWPCVETH
jgi:uncharacterized protein (DUF736 family)